MKIIPIILGCIFFGLQLNAQQLTGKDFKALVQKEDSLRPLATRIIQGIEATDKFSADSLFTRAFVRALVTKNSFAYPFDSLQTISKLYAPDSSFRIFTWQMVINENIIRQHGAIQMRTRDGSLKLFPLIDKSDITQNMADTIGNNYGWIGAVYYKLIYTTYQDKPYYTLLGFDQNNIRSDKKIIEELTFENGQPVFGKRNFVIENANLATKNMARYVMEFKKETSPRLTFDTDLNMIVMEHLISESNEPNKKWTLIPDGDYEGFKWINGRWAYVSKIFNDITPEGKEPVPAPIRNTEGDIDYSKLKGNGGVAPVKPTAPVKKVED